jgi:hypothetical protein
MKIKLDIDATPVEMRVFFGLPDVSTLHDEMLSMLRERMRAGAEGYDPLTLMSAFIPQGVQGVEALQKMFWEAMRQNFNLGGDAGKR